MTTKITVKDNGPLRIEGEFEIYDVLVSGMILADETPSRSVAAARA